MSETNEQEYMRRIAEAMEQIAEKLEFLGRQAMYAVETAGQMADSLEGLDKQGINTFEQNGGDS